MNQWTRPPLCPGIPVHPPSSNDRGTNDRSLERPITANFYTTRGTPNPPIGGAASSSLERCRPAQWVECAAGQSDGGYVCGVTRAQSNNNNKLGDKDSCGRQVWREKSAEPGAPSIMSQHGGHGVQEEPLQGKTTALPAL